MKDCISKIIVGVYIFLFGLAAGTSILGSRNRLVEQSPIAFSQPNENKYESAQESTVSVRVGPATGSGVIIKRGAHVFVWTANHVVDETNTARVVRTIHFGAARKAEIAFNARVIARLPNTDAALLWVDAPASAFRGAVFSSEPPRVGTPLFHVGSMLGVFDGSITRGILSQVGVNPATPDWPPFWPVTDQTDLRMCPGSSGGPVFIDATAEVAGLVVGGPGAGSFGIGCYVPVREIERGAKLRAVSWAVRGDLCPSDAVLEFLAALYVPAPELPKQADPDKKPDGDTKKSKPGSVDPHQKPSFFPRLR